MSERLDIVISERGGREVARTIEEVGTTAGHATGAITGLKLAVAGLTNALSVLGFINASILTPIALLVGGTVAARSAINVFGDFEEQMNATAVAAGATALQQDQLARSARELSQEWGLANDVVAAGMEDLAKAGVDAQSVIDGAAEATIVLAQATGAQLPEAATIAARAMNVFGFAAQDMMYVANQVAGTVNTTTFSLNDYMLALGQAGAIAADQRIPFEEFNAGLAAASAYFTSGSDQGTSFRTFLLRLTPVTDEAKRAVEDLGLSFRDAEGFLLPLPDIVDELQRALAPLDDEGRTKALKEIFGEDAYRLAAFYMQQGGDAIREFMDDIIPAADAVEMARARLEGLWGSLRKLKAAVSEFFLVIIETGIGDTFALAIDGITLAVKGLIAVLKFLSPILPFLAARFLQLAGGFILQGILLLGSGFKNLLGSIVKMFPALIGLTSLFKLTPFGLLTTAILTAGLALLQFSDKIKVTQDGQLSLADVSYQVFNDIVIGAQDMAAEVASLFLYMTHSGEHALHGLGEESKTVWDKMTDHLKDALVSMTFLLFRFRAIVGTIWTSIKETIEGGGPNDDQFGARMYEAQIESMREAADYIMEFRERAQASALSRETRPDLEPGTQPWDRPEDADGQLTRAEYLRQEAQGLQDSLGLLKLYNRERDVQSEVMRINNHLMDQYNQELGPGEREVLENSIRLLNDRTRAVGEMDNIIEDTVGSQEQLVLRMQALNALMAEGGPMAGVYGQQLRDAQLEMLEFKVNSGQGGFADGFLLELARMVQGVENIRARIGQSFMNMFSSFADGASDSIARALVYAEDLGTALQDVARSALTELISALIKMGIQWLLNATMGQTIASALTAASVAQAGIVAAAWAPAAAAVSLASFGANAVPATAGMTSAYTLAQAMAALGGLGLKDGGWAFGPGGSRGDHIPAMLSDGEFVVNSGAARRNRGLLEDINTGRAPRGGGGMSVYAPVTIQTSGGGTEDGVRAGRAAAREFEKRVLGIYAKHSRPGGALYGGGR